MTGVALDLDNPQLPYQQVAADIREQIRSGALPIGQQLPSVRELAGDYSVSTGTIQQALRLLRDAQLVTTWQGRGSFVRRSDMDGEPTEPTAQKIMMQLDMVMNRLERLEQQVEALEHGEPRSKRSPGK